jgi:arabinofuranan 3-O-arabinosyltransferase
MLDRFRHHLMMRFIDPLGNWLDDHADTIVWVVFHRYTRGIAAWMVALGISAMLLSQAWDSFDDSRRKDGNSGHCTIDFGGQWLMGAMLVSGNGRELYNRNYQRPVLVAHYPRSGEDPEAVAKGESSDAEKLMSYFMGSDTRSAADTIASFGLPLAAGDDGITALALTLSMQDGWTPLTLEKVTANRIGGPLYPPINAFIYAPLGMMEPHTGYRINQIMNVFWAFIAA